MRISTKPAIVLAIISIVSTAIAAEPAEARRWGSGAYGGGGHGWRAPAYSRPGFYRYGFYPRTYRYRGYPGYYGRHYGHGNDVAIAVGAGLLGLMLGTAISSRNSGYEDRRRGNYYQSYDNRSYDSEHDRYGYRGYDRRAEADDRAERDSARYYDSDGNYDPYRYYRGDSVNNPYAYEGEEEGYDREWDGETDYGAVGM